MELEVSVGCGVGDVEFTEVVEVESADTDSPGTRVSLELLEEVSLLARDGLDDPEVVEDPVALEELDAEDESEVEVLEVVDESEVEVLELVDESEVEALLVSDGMTTVPLSEGVVPEFAPPVDGAGVIVSPLPVSHTRPFGSVAIPLMMVVPLESRKTPLLYRTSGPCQPATFPVGDGFV